MNRFCAALLCCLLAPGAGAAGGEHPQVMEIAFEGNDTTRPSTMLREMVIAVGDPADPALIERSRQGVLDLGLFKGVSVRQEPVQGGVRLVFHVEERYYILPTPRLDAKSDGSNSYGAQLRWSNVAGLNHSLRVIWQSADRQQRNVGRETSYAASYAAPYLFDRRNGASVGAGYTTRPVEGAAGEYEETFRSASLFGTHAFSDAPTSTGWTGGAGLAWSRQDARGALAPLPYGEATALVMTLTFRDLHYKVYSEQGTSYGGRVETAAEGWLSDYDYNRFTAGFTHYRPVGTAENQTLHFFANLGSYHGGAAEVRAFGLGGASTLRGYEKSFVEGNAYWYAATEFARPVIWPWLRAVAMFEAGNVYARPDEVSLDKVHTSLGLGLRVRLTNFVDFEVEFGYAIPLNGGAGRLFASRV